MNVKPIEHKKVSIGKGAVYLIKQNPKEFVLNANSANTYLDLVKHAYEFDAKAGKLSFKNNLYLQRGPYDIVSVMDESVSNEPYIIKGPVIDLFDPNLPVLSEKVIKPGEQALLYNLLRIKDKTKPMVLATASRIYNEVRNGRAYSFICKSPAKTVNSIRVLLPAKPTKSTVLNNNGEEIAGVNTSWDESSNTLYLGFDNSPDGIKVNLTW
jgi:hypothetical protein